ncbi:MAG TPA: sigma-70 family RNA polymerase sigma factor [Gemmataceae bacterium]|jgi:RNA polymerase sigma factor (sigma-70 family)
MPKLQNGRFLSTLRRVVVVREAADRTDGQLLTAFIRDRDGDAFAALVHRHGPMVLGVARRVIGDSHLADDAFQAVFLVLARRAGAVRPREQVGNWLYGVAYRTAMKARTVLARRRSREKQVDAMPEPPAKHVKRIEAADWSELQPVIDEELARLPDKLRLPVVLCDLEGRPQRAVAKQLGVAAGTLTVRLASARRLLAERLKRKGISLSGGALAVVLGERASAASVAAPLADATVRAAEAIAEGTVNGLAGLVSAQALQLCEGVMRMMMLSKLKTVAMCALAALTLSGGLGFGLLPAQAGDEPKATSRPAPTHSKGRATKANTDAEFLRRICFDLTGKLPNRVELAYFTADTDAEKRAKVIDWLLGDEAVIQHLGKVLKVAPERIRVVRRTDARTGRTYRTALIATPKPLGIPVQEQSLAFSPDGRALYAAEIRSAEQAFAVAGRTLFVTEPKAPSVVLWDRNTGKRIDAQVASPAAVVNGEIRLDIGAPEPGEPYYSTYRVTRVIDLDSDPEFLKRVIQSARCSAPTTLELKYFIADKDPKKREKLLDLLLKDPIVAKKVGDAWKKKMLEPPAIQTTVRKAAPIHVRPLTLEYHRLDLRSLPAEIPSKFEKLVGELIAAKKSDEQILEAVTLAAASRWPTAEEKKATLAVIGTLTDKKAAWIAIAKALTPASSK